MSAIEKRLEKLEVSIKPDTMIGVVRPETPNTITITYPEELRAMVSLMVWEENFPEYDRILLKVVYE